MAVISGQKRDYVKEIKQSGVVTETEFTQRINDHILNFHGEAPPGIALPYQKDLTINRYIGTDSRSIPFFDPGANKKNVFLQYIPGVPSSTVPFIPPFASVITNIQWRSSLAVTATNTFDVLKNGTIIFSGQTNGTSASFSGLGLLVSQTDNITVYINNFSQTIPVVTLTMVRDYGPIV